MTRMPRPSESAPQGVRADTTRQRHREIHDLLAKGVGTNASAPLNRDPKTVRRYVEF